MKPTNNICFCILAILLMLLTPELTYAANVVKIVSVSVQAGNECTLEVQVNNSDAFVAFQTDIPIPSEFSYVAGSAQLITGRISGHLLSAGIVGSTLRLIVFSVDNTPFVGNTGTLISFRLKAGKVPGNYSLSLNNTTLGNSVSQNILTSTLDGTITILGPNIQNSSSSLDFGRVALTTSASQSVIINNIGNQNLVIDSLDFSNPQFTSPDSTGFTIIPGGDKSVTVTFAPSAKGIYSKQMKIISNDPDDSVMVVGLQAVGFAVNELHGGNIMGASGDTAKLEFTINNMEAFVGFQFDLDLPQPMSYLAGSATLSRHQDHLTLANMIDNNTLRVVAFSTSAMNFTGNNGQIISLKFLLDGVAGNYGIDLHNVIIVNNLGENIVSASSIGSLQITSSDIHTQTQLDFGDVSVLEEGENTLPIYNYGQEPLIIGTLNFSNPVFSSTYSLPDTILPSGQINLPIKFSKSTKGSATGSMQILSNDPDENPFVVTLTGNAFVPNYLVVVSDTVKQGDSIVISIEVMNKEPFVAFQCDMDFPAGLSPNLDGIMLTERKQDHVFVAKLIATNRLRIVSWSPNQNSFTSEAGGIITIPFKTNFSISEGTHPLIPANCILSNVNLENVLYSTQNGSLTVEKGNQPPIANAGSDQTVDEGKAVNLDGSLSEDPELLSITYLWTAPADITLSDTTIFNPTFTAPKVDADTSFIIILVVNDGVSDSPPDTVFINVINTTVPVNLPLTNLTIGDGETECFDAFDTIKVAGGGTTVNFLDGSLITLIAGKSIRFLPDFHAFPGSQLDAYITTDSSFCDIILGLESPIPLTSNFVTHEKVVVGVNNSSVKEVKIFPNPSKGKFTIQFSNNSEPFTIRVFNILGDILYSSKNSNFDNSEIDISTCPQGVYFVRIFDRKASYLMKIMKY